MRVILQSVAYQRSSVALEGNKLDDRFYSRYYPKRMMAELLLDSVSAVTGEPTKFAGFPDGFRALQLPSSSAASYFLSTFGRPERLVTCTCERNDQPTMVQVLHIANGDTLNNKLRADRGAVARLAASGASGGEIVETLFRSALSRSPTATERDGFLAEFDAAVEDLAADEAAAARRQAIEDLYWAVLTSQEFLFNH